MNKRAKVYGPGKLAPVIIWQDGAACQVEYCWGLPPFKPGGRPVSLLRSEGRSITSPCLIIANDFSVRPDGSKRSYRVSLITDQPFFCLAGVWRPASAGWPASYAALTVPASPDIAPIKDRHVAVVRAEDWEAWLRQARPAEEILRPFPRGSFEIIGPKAPTTGDLFGR
jgi:putative SOS response-associated peptidase YedK